MIDFSVVDAHPKIRRKNQFSSQKMKFEYEVKFLCINIFTKKKIISLFFTIILRSKPGFHSLLALWSIIEPKWPLYHVHFKRGRNRKGALHASMPGALQRFMGIFVNLQSKRRVRVSPTACATGGGKGRRCCHCPFFTMALKSQSCNLAPALIAVKPLCRLYTKTGHIVHNPGILSISLFMCVSVYVHAFVVFLSPNRWTEAFSLSASVCFP